MTGMWRRIAAGAALLGSMAGWQGSAFAGSDNSSDTYAGDYQGMALPTGTFLAIDYAGFRQSDQYITTPNNIFSTLTGGQHTIPSTGVLYTDIVRLSYFASLWNHPLIIEAAVPFVDVRQVNIGNLAAPVGGLGPQTIRDGVADPVIFITYGLISDPRNERFLGFTNYFYLPNGNYNKFMQVNIGTPGQTTWVPQIGYSEGLGKFNPGLHKFWFDLIANTSVHSDGGSPVALAPGVQFDKLTQSESYDVKAFLRYEFGPAAYVAAGIEKSWGGDLVASGGVLQTIFGGPQSLGKDDFTKGHLQGSFPITRDIHIAADVTHDFERQGGLKEFLTAEIRVTKLFLPQAEPLK
jgi:hypothetical protein